MQNVSQRDDTEIKEYLESCADAAKRTRTLMIVLTVVSVLLFYSALYTLQPNWKLQRLQALGDIHSHYATSKLGPPPEDASQYPAYQEHYNQLYSRMLGDYVDATYTVQVPFFGLKVDVSDMGWLGGLAYVVILILLRFSLTRELTNLSISFGRLNETSLERFYYMLAMRQVQTIPPLPGKKRSRFLSNVPKVMCLIPMLVYSLVAVQDFKYAFLGAPLRFSSIYFREALFFVAIGMLTVSSFRRFVGIDAVWNHYWRLISGLAPAPAKSAPVSEELP
jgi:hypothetical protein